MNNPTRLPHRELKITALACRRGELVLFEDVDFHAIAGEIFLLRGPNGVGKTTLLMTLAGIITPFEGRIDFIGTGDDEGMQANIHFLGHLPAVKPRLTVIENLRFWVAVNGGMTRDPQNALDAVGLGELGELDAGVLSAGQTRRLALARLIVSPRPIWLLDEPTASLDASGEALVAELIDAHLDNGGLVVSTTHHDLALKNLSRVKTLVLGRPA